MRLQDALAQLAPEARESLRKRRGLEIDPRKKIDEIEQTARGLVAETDLRHSRFPSDARALLQRLAIGNGALTGAGHDPGADLLCELGIAYRVPDAAAPRRAKGAARTDPARLVLPGAFVVQVPVSDGDDPRGLRVCLGFVEPETLPSLVLTVVGRPLAVGTALALQEVWEVLSGPNVLAQQIAALPSAEARLLRAIEGAGGEVTTEELLALDQTPGLYRTAAGVAVPKRGAPFLLQRRGLLYPLGADRFVIPTEVARIVGEGRRAEREARRAHLLASLAADDHAPRRARYARNPSLAAAAALAMLRCWDAPVRDDTGTPRGTLRRIADRLGEREETVAMHVALARAAGLGRLLLRDADVPGSLAEFPVADLGGALRVAWRRGGAWDETRLDPEVLRANVYDRATTAAPVLRMLVSDALEELARERWVPVDLVLRFVLDDPRSAGATRMHERARRDRPDTLVATLADAVKRIVTESLPAIGVVDLADDAGSVRLATRERSGNEGAEHVAAMVGRTGIECPAGVALHRVLALADVAEPDYVRPESGVIGFALGVAALARARAHGIAADEARSRFEGLGLRAPWPPAVTDLIEELGALREIGMLAVGAALVVVDAGLRAELRSDPSLRRALLDVDAGPVLLVRDDVDLARVQARLQRLGVQAHAVLVAAPEGTVEPSASVGEPSVASVHPQSRPTSPDGTRRDRSR